MDAIVCYTAEAEGLAIITEPNAELWPSVVC